jgi:inositol-phosphate phosphatase/L-galactose 1-phosphate phosphatase/histidinol-phosphatase
MKVNNSTLKNNSAIKNHAIADCMAQWLAEAGEVILRLMQRDYHAELKEDFTPVTVIDKAVESLLRERIMQHFPAMGIRGEEFPPHQPDADDCFWIDPIDGTRALLAGFPTFTILLGLAHRGIPQLGAIYQPITKELWVSAGKPPIPYQTRPCSRLEHAFFSTTSPFLFAPEHQPRIATLLNTVMAYQLGGDGYAYAKLASGKIDLILESGLKPYDFMALVPVITAAGGVITDWQGQPLTVHSEGNICAAGDIFLHKEALEFLTQ